MVTNLKILSIRFFYSLLIFIFGLYFYPTVFDSWGYMYSISLGPIPIINSLIITGMLFVLIVFTNYKKTLFRHVFDVLILGIFMPISSMVLLIDSRLEYALIPFISLILITITISALNKSIIKNLIGGGFRDGIPLHYFYKIGLLIFFATIGMLIQQFGISNIGNSLLTTFMETYEIRGENRSSGLLGYLLGWTILLYFPILTTLAFERKQYRYLIIGFFGSFVIFQSLALKVIFLNYILLIGFCFGYSYFKESYKVFLPHMAFMFVFLLGVVGDDIGTAILDRFYYLVGLNSVFYFEYFSINPPMYFSGTMLDIGYGNYNIPPGFVIDNAYYGGSGSNSSAGYLPSIFADLRWLGVIFVSILLGLFFMMIESIEDNSPLFAYLLAIALVFALMNHPFMMLFLSNGLIFVLMISFFVRSNTKLKK
tara:strand:+ start:14242 stop:15516 length:1275 start_codon:yes stop_codon:yes gene_type:complete